MEEKRSECFLVERSYEEQYFQLKTKFHESKKDEFQLCNLIMDNEIGKLNFMENACKLQKNQNKKGEEFPLLDQDFFNFIQVNQTEIMDHIKRVQNSTEPFSLNFFGLETLKRKYLLQTHDGYLESIDNFLIRVSLYIWRDNWVEFQSMYRNLRNRNYIHATPTLFNAGCKNAQLASCFLLGVEDSITSIYDNLKNVAIISKNAGGVGLHISSIRGADSYIYGSNGHSNGIVPMLRVFNSTAKYVDQGGGKRNGSFAIYIEPHHIDIFSFLEMKKNTAKPEVVARDLFYAIWMNDLYMKQVLNDGSWYLFCPNEAKGLADVHGEAYEILYWKYVKENKYRKEIRARELWTQILRTCIETGSPYILFKDQCNRCSNQQNLGTIKSSNLCTEIIQYSSPDEIAVCNLASISLPSCLQTNPKLEMLKTGNLVLLSKENCSFCDLAKFYLKKHDIPFLENPSCSSYISSSKTFPKIFHDGEFIGGFQEVWENYLCPIFDYEKLGRLSESLVRNLNQVIDINHYPLEACKNSNMKHRPLGIGCSGLANVFFEMLEPYTSEKARSINRKIFETMYFYSLKQSIALAKESGFYSSFPNSPASRGQLHFDLFSKDNQYTHQFHYDWDSLRSQLIQYGMKNSLLIALMPTASTSQILGNTESFEPLTSHFFLRRTLSGEFCVINRQLQDLLLGINLWNEDMKDKLIFYKGSVQSIQELPKFLKEVYRTVWEIPQKSLIEMASDRGYFVDQSQSFNIYLPEASIPLLEKILLYGWKKQLKTGAYYTRLGSTAIAQTQNFFLTKDKESQIIQQQSTDSSKDIEYMECENCSS